MPQINNNMANRILNSESLPQTKNISAINNGEFKFNNNYEFNLNFCMQVSL